MWIIYPVVALKNCRKELINMDLYNVKTVTVKQARAYSIIALNTLGVAPNDLSVNLLDEEIKCVMKLYSPRDAVKKAEEILENGGSAIWKKK